MRLGDKVYCEQCKKLIRDYREYEVMRIDIPTGRIPRYCDDECLREKNRERNQEYRWKKKREQEAWDELKFEVGGLLPDDIRFPPSPIGGLTAEDILQM